MYLTKCLTKDIQHTVE